MYSYYPYKIVLIAPKKLIRTSGVQATNVASAREGVNLEWIL
jgi:hypothetical protein